MRTITAFEKHTFSTCIDEIAFINIVISVEGPSKEAIEAEASKTRCSIIASHNKIVLVRNGCSIDIPLSDISVEAIPPHVQLRLINAGCPIDCRQTGAAEKAIKGLEDGSMVVSDEDLTASDLSIKEILSDEMLVAEITQSDHISYGVSFAPNMQGI